MYLQCIRMIQETSTKNHCRRDDGDNLDIVNTRTFHQGSVPPLSGRHFSQANARKLDNMVGGDRPRTSLHILQLCTAARSDKRVQDTGLPELILPSFWDSQQVALYRPGYIYIYILFLCDTPCAYASIRVASATQSSSATLQH